MTVTVNDFKPRAVKWLHFRVFSTILARWLGAAAPPPTKTLLKSEETTCIAITCCIFHRGVYRGVRGAKPPNTQTSLPNIMNPTASHSLKSDLESRLAYPRPRPRPILAYPRPRPRLSSFKTKTKTKTCSVSYTHLTLPTNREV